MCGIAGQVSLDGHRPVDRELIQRMTRAIAHRGPDGDGHYVVGPVGLGHRRLAIIDVDTGAQPMCNEDRSVWITFNGEIYNFQDLRKDLLKRGHLFRSESDTEVIVHLYEEFGEECVTRLKGMFAFAIWDCSRRKLFLARDRLGIKPLYFTVTGTSLLFASEIKALLEDPTVARAFNPAAIARFLTYYYLPGEGTLFENIHRLEPAHTMTVCDGVISKRSYWDLDFATDRRWTSFDAAVEALQELLSKTVQRHLISDVPVGVLLSGGVDSTAMLRYASEHSAGPLQAFTIGFAGQSFADERPYAQLAARTYGARHHAITLSARDFGDLLPKYAWHMEEPICEPPAVALYAVSRLARDASVKVLLSGEGGDEAFGGYNKYAYLLALESMKTLFGSAKPLLRAGLGLLAGHGMPQLRNYIPLVDLPLSEYYFSCTSSPFSPLNRLRPSLQTAAFAQSTRHQMAHAPTRHLFDQARHLPKLHQMLRVDTKTWLPDDLLIKADKMTMAASVELRVPFLDSDVMEFAASLPASYKVRGWPPKRILRAALKNSIPEEILKRKKVGFPVPYEAWLRQDLKEFVHDTIHSDSGGLRNYFTRDGLSKLTDAHVAGDVGGQDIFSLLVLAMLRQQFAARPDTDAAAPPPRPTEEAFAL